MLPNEMASALLLANGEVFGRIFKDDGARRQPMDVDIDLSAPSRPHADARYAESREAAMGAFAKSCRRE